MDLSGKKELKCLGELVGAVQDAAPAGDWLLVGAMARDLLIQYGHGIAVGRATEDVDLGIAVRDWDEFARVRRCLVDSGRFSEVDGIAHRLVFETRIEVDLVPFGGVEKTDGTIAWPPDGHPRMSVVGFSEALKAADRIRLPGDREVAVVCLPFFILLKVNAWSERHRRRRGIDANDLLLVLSTYIDCGNQDRLFEDHADLLQDPDFDYELAGPLMAGRDLKNLLENHGAEQHPALVKLRAILGPQLESDAPGPMLQEVPAHRIEEFERLLSAFKRGLNG